MAVGARRCVAMLFCALDSTCHLPLVFSHTLAPVRSTVVEAGADVMASDALASTTGVALMTERVPRAMRERYLLRDEAPPAPEAGAAIERTWHAKSRVTLSLLDDFVPHTLDNDLGRFVRYHYERTATRAGSRRPADRFVPLLFANDMYNHGDDYVPVDDAEAVENAGIQTSSNLPKCVSL